MPAATSPASVAASPEISADWLRAHLPPLAEETLRGSGLSAAAALPPRAFAPLARYLALCSAWNTRINLSGARDAAALCAHLADALPVLPRLPAEEFRGVDVGAGAGFPGMVLALLRPDSRWLLLEPNYKKSQFLKTAARELAGFARVQVLRARFEPDTPGLGLQTAFGDSGELNGGELGGGELDGGELGGGELNGGGILGAGFEVALSRALWPARKWLQKAPALLAPGGRAFGFENIPAPNPAAAAPAPAAPPHAAPLHSFPYTLNARRRALLMLGPLPAA